MVEAMVTSWPEILPLDLGPGTERLMGFRYQGADFGDEVGPGQARRLAQRFGQHARSDFPVVVAAGAVRDHP